MVGQRPDPWANHDTTGMGVPHWSTYFLTDPEDEHPA
jgi:hypothetical protein